LVSKLPKLTHLFLDVRDNEIQGEGTVNAIQYLANKFWNVLHLKLSNNGLNDADIKLMLPHLVQLLKNSNIFIL
jgi:Ran GTPase-activating protein (RanGAP) involved in mRNA processing and transport